MEEIKYATPENVIIPTKAAVITIEQKPEDHILGVTILPEPDKILRENGQYDDCLPRNEIQHLGEDFSRADTYFCVTYSNHNCKETNYKAEYGEDIDLDEKFTAIGSGTVRGQGNSFTAVAEFERQNGFILETGAVKNAKTLDELFVPNTQAQKDEAKKSLTTYKSTYRWVKRPFGSQSAKPEDMIEALKYGALQVCVGGTMYQSYQGGLWGSNEAVNYTHAVEIFGYEVGKYWKVFDSENNQNLKVIWDYPFGTPMLNLLKKKVMFRLIKTSSPAVYLHCVQSGDLYAIADGDEVTGGQLLKSFSGNYANANITVISEEEFAKYAYVGEIKAINHLTE